VLSFGEIIEFAFVIMTSVKKTEQTSVAETQVESISSPHEPELLDKTNLDEKISTAHSETEINSAAEIGIITEMKQNDSERLRHENSEYSFQI